jgi:adenylate cyclase
VRQDTRHAGQNPWSPDWDEPVTIEERPEHEAEWREVLLGRHPEFRLGRKLFKHIPSQPRCKLCAAPFRGAGGPLMRLIGKSPWPKNPKYCGSCFRQLTERHGGAEINCSLLFADVRGSTALAEQLGTITFRAMLERFYSSATDVLVDHDAIVDKYVGDEVIGIFIPALNGARHAAQAIAAARALLTEIDWLPVGAGVHTGPAFVGAVGAGANVDISALGDTVNTAARLASVADSGEILVTVEAATAAGLNVAESERRDLELKGKRLRTTVFVLRAA